MRWSDLRLRVASGLVLAPAALALAWIGSPVWPMLAGVVAIGLGIEWSQLCGRPARSAPALLAAGCMVVVVALTASGDPQLALFLLAAGTVAFLVATRSAILAWGLPYIGIAAIALVWLRDDAFAGRANLLFVVAVVWASDIGGYVVGRLAGGRLLAPSISPGKTWSGAIGSVGAALAIGGIACGLTPGSAPRHAFMVAAVLGLVAQAGDLLESLFKRGFGVKDSGSLIPGHGGLLDRLDGLLAAGPAAAMLAASDAGRGVLLWQ